MDTDWAWAAGLFEGEGNISFYSKSSVVLQLGMTDEDVVERFMHVVGCGATKIYPSKDNNKTVYLWRAGRKEEVSRVLRLIVLYLGERRRKRAHEALARLENNRGWRFK